jgi:eukaryotic-like serine/threonine-protein kinase
MADAVTLVGSGDDWLAGGRPPQQPADLDQVVGQSLGKYHIDSFLGAGAMGRVYLAHHLDLQRNCALKILLPQRASQDADYVHRFFDEGRAAAQLVHPNIVTVHALGQVEHLYFLEMEYVPGRSLGHILTDEQRLEPILAASIAMHVADGLAVAHSEGIVHRDLKPDNILMSLRGVPKITDFGLCKRIDQAPGNGQTRLAGTPHFMAPELFRGLPPTPASDIYALGVTLYLAAAGRLPYDHDTVVGLAAQVVDEPLVPVRTLNPRIPLELAECVALFLDKAPENRPQDGLAASALLKACIGKSRDLRGMVAEAFQGHPTATVRADDDDFEIEIALPNARRQRVLVSRIDRHSVEAFVRVSSLCGRATQTLYEAALKMNGDMAHGGIGLREIGGEWWFEVSDTYPRMTVDPEEIRHSVYEVAALADSIERLLSSEDRY